MVENILNILIIDDCEDDCLFYEEALLSVEGAHYNVIVTHNAEQGIQAATNARPDCVLLDYNLPEMSGLDILLKLRQAHPFLPVIVLTGQGSEAIAVEVMKAGAKDYITKSLISPNAMHRIIFNAITRSRLEMRIASQQESLEHFTRALAHDLREPMRTINSFNQLLIQRESLSQDGKKYSNYIGQAVGHMQQLLTNVANLTRLDSQTAPLTERIELHSIIEQVIINCKRLIDESGAVILCDNNLPIIEGEKSILVQLFQNLIVNAIQYSPEGRQPKITINCESHDYEMRITVADNGEPITQDFQEEIFSPFKRLHSKNESGSGLGLAICKRIAELHHARIWCENTKEGGNAFIFAYKFETKKPQQSSTVAPLGLNAMENLDSVKDLAHVLIVDDNPIDLELVRLMLMENTPLNFNLHTVNSGKKALEWLHDEQKPKANLILLDINMPGMNGFETLSAIKNDDELRTIPVSMLSTSDDVNDTERATKMDANGYMVKPADIVQLRKIVQNIPALEVITSASGSQLMHLH